MLRYAKRFWFLAAALAALAGYVDAVGFLELGGLFVSFMSGNSTRLSVALATRSAAALLAGGLIGGFVLGVVGGALVATRAGRWRKTMVLALVSTLLTVAGLLDGYWPGPWPMLVLAMAMGAENTVFQRGGEVSIGVTYMTGTLVKLGQHLAATLLGGPRWAWLPYLLLWSGLVAGATLGATAHAWIGASAIWAAAAFAAALCFITRRVEARA